MMLLRADGGRSAQQAGNRIMAKYYIESGRVRVVLAAETAEQAALRAFQRSHQRQVAIYSEPPSEIIRDAEAVQWQLDDEILVSEAGFGRSDAEVFDTLDIAALWQGQVFGEPCRTRIAPVPLCFTQL
jgi:hypothetical protein